MSVGAKGWIARALFALTIRDGDAAAIPARHREANEIRLATDAAAPR